VGGRAWGEKKNKAFTEDEKFPFPEGREKGLRRLKRKRGKKKKPLLSCRLLLRLPLAKRGRGSILSWKRIVR